MGKKIKGFEETFLKGNPEIKSYHINPDFEEEFRLVREENPDMDPEEVLAQAINSFIGKNK